MKAQSSTEFLIMLSVAIAVFAVSVFIYAKNLEEAQAFSERLEASKICLEASSVINSFSALGGNSSYALDLPEYAGYRNYTVWVVSGERYVKVDVGSSGIGCAIAVSNLTNSSGSAFFRLERNATIRNDGGVLVVEP